MPRRNTRPMDDDGTKRPPGTTPEAREIQMISLADSLAEKQMREGTASAQVITHYLKLGSTREKLENDKLRKDIQLKDAQIAQLASAQNIENLYAEAINAMREYGGGGGATEKIEAEERARHDRY